MAHREGMVEALRAKVLEPAPGEEEWAQTVADVLPEVVESQEGPTVAHFTAAARTSARCSAASIGGWRLEHVRAIERAGGEEWELLCEVGAATLARRASE